MDKLHQQLPPDFNKEALIVDLMENVEDASKFLDLTPRNQQSICIDCGIDGWKDTIVSAIQEMVM